MKVKWPATRLLFVGLVGLAVGTVAAVIALSTDRGSARSVTVSRDGVVVSHDSLDDALAEASSLAGFRVVAPASLPSGLRVHDILVHPELQEASGAASPFRLVTLQLEVGDKRFLMDELRGAFNPVLSGELLKGAVSGAEVYFDKTDTAVIYSMLASGRGFILSFPLEQAIDQASTLELLAAFAEEVP